MKYYNTLKAYVPVGPRESVGPFATTRDFTDEEVQKSPELRYAIFDRKYLVPFDPAKHFPKAVKAVDPRAPKANWVTAPDSEGGERKTITTPQGQKVEYIMADAEGVDGISNPGEADMVAAIDGQKSVDFIEPGLDASPKKADPTWKTASDKFEEALKEETTQDLEYNDDETISEGEAERPEIPDADEEIARDYATIITKPEGNMGARETTAQAEVKTAMAQGTAALAEATRQNFDDAEPTGADVSEPVKDFLAQSFATKKWGISKETNKDFLAEVSLVTKSENVKSLADQRLTELG